MSQGDVSSFGTPERPARVQLGAELRKVRSGAGRSVSDVPGYDQSHISQVERGLVNPSWVLVREYIKLGGDRNGLQQLYERMLTESNALRSAQQKFRHPTDAPPREVVAETNHHDVRRHYILRARRESYIFDDAGVVATVHCNCLLVAKDPGVRLFVTRHTYDSDLRPDVLCVHAIRGCTIETRRTFHNSSLVEAYLRLDHEVDPNDEPYEFSYRIQVTSQQRATPKIQFRASEGLDVFNLTAQFRPGARPTSLWWFAAPDTITVEQRSQCNRIIVDGNGRCHKQFEQPAAGWYYGFTWTWPFDRGPTPVPRAASHA